jgi:hypothetical protein
MTGESPQPAIRSWVTGRAIFTTGHTLGVHIATSIRDSEASIVTTTGATGTMGDDIAMAVPLMTPTQATPPTLGIGTEAAARITTGGSGSREGSEKETVISTTPICKVRILSSCPTRRSEPRLVSSEDLSCCSSCLG